MQAQFTFPPNTNFVRMGDFVVAYAGEMAIAVFDSRAVKYVVEPEPQPNPTPTPTPTPPETEIYEVVSTGRLRLRADHSTSAEIVGWLQPGQDIALEKNTAFEDAENKILWRKTYPDGFWVAVKLGDNIYAVPIDTSSRAG